MSSSTRYIVEIDLDVVGDLPGEMGKTGRALDGVDSKAKGLGSTLGSLGSKLVSGFTGAVETIGSSLMTLGKVGIGAAVGGATYGVMSLNKELETTRVSLAAVLNSNGLTESIESGMQRAASWVSQMRKDARDLPGEFSDLLYIVQSGAGAAFQAGLDDASFEKIAANSMAAAKALSVPMQQAGRELAHLLQGHAGSQNVFGMRLGFSAENFNDLSRGEQVTKITEALDKFQPAINVFGKTFDAASSTLVDHVKIFASTATSGLFERVVSTLSEVNAWFDANQATVKLWADKVSQMLVHAWDDGRKLIEEWGPSILDFASRFYDKFVSTWHEVEPLVKSVASSIKSFLDDPEGIDKLTGALKLYAGLKVVGAAGGLMGGSGVGSAVMNSGLLSGAGSALQGVAISGMGAAGNAAGALGGAVGTLGGGTVALLAGIQAAIVGAIAATGYEIYSARDHASTVDAKGGGAYGYSAGAQTFVDKQVAAAIAAGAGAETKYRTSIAGWRRDNRVENMGGDASAPLEEWKVVLAGYKAEYERAEDNMMSFANATLEASDSMGELQSIIKGLARSGDFEAIAKINQGVMDAQQNAAFAAQESERNDDFFRGSSAALGVAALKSIDAFDKREKDRAKKAAAGSGNVNIARVEITVSNNNAPGQVARDVAKELADMKRYRRSSPNALNVSAGR